jgi:hypothetical protein
MLEVCFISRKKTSKNGLFYLCSSSLLVTSRWKMKKQFVIKHDSSYDSVSW